MSRSNTKRDGSCEETRARHLVLVDIENIAATPCPTPVDLADVQWRLQQVIPDWDAAQCVVACNHRAAATVSFGFPGALRRWRSGPDGADLALIEEMSDLRIMRRFGGVTLCSGDGIFAESLAALAHAGIETTMVSRPGSLSRQLQMAGQQIVMLPPNDTTSPSAALKEVG